LNFAGTKARASSSAYGGGFSSTVILIFNGISVDYYEFLPSTVCLCLFKKNQELERIFRDIGFSDFIHRPGIKKQTKEKHDVSETGSVSVIR
jgi:hypothetical protein